MEFGKIDDISLVDWTLPNDDPGNEARGGGGQVFKLFFGSPAWGCKHWRGKIYPQDAAPEEFLHYYSRQFNCIELNTTHYRIPSAQTAADWLSHVPSEFKFCPKVHKSISHNRMGMVDKDLIKEWVGFMETVGGNLGPCFIQFHESFSYGDKLMLFRFLENWPPEFELALEFRHNSWFQKGRILPALADYLHTRRMGLVITDVAGRRDVLHGTLSVPWTMVRLIGNDLHASDELRLKDWAQRLSHWQKKGIERSYLFLHQPDDHWTIEFAQMAEKVMVNEGFGGVPHFELTRERDLLSMQG